MKLHSNPRITLVGAGPGDPELISIKGMKAIQSADAILYDALAGKELLDYAPAHCTKLNVGKRGGCVSHQQSTINELLVHCAYKYGHVVRLKGGDPFVFGRGYEEIVYAEERGLKTTVIPGISSSIAVPALEGIPLTVRGINESFWVTTATLSSGELSNDVRIAASSSATVVILMGLSKITEIMDIFHSNGRGELPVAVIQNGSLATQKIALGTVDTIVQEVCQQQITSPAIIIAGEVVRLHKQFGKEAFLQIVMQSIK